MLQVSPLARLAMSTIFLAHGLFGFGDLLPGFTFVNYFNGVAARLVEQGHKVIAPTVRPIGSIEMRGGQLASSILAQTQPDEHVHIIGHSMGGLDARQALSNNPEVARRVATLVTIGTPHHGSPVADAVVNDVGPLFGKIPLFLLPLLKANAGAFHDLTTVACAQFNDQTPDVKGIRYIEVAGNPPPGSHELLLLQLAARIGEITNEANDGVVTRTSALREGHENLPDWPVDHLGEIGWTVILRPTEEHLQRYETIAGLFRPAAATA
jgi:triacylglycerol lipase